MKSFFMGVSLCLMMPFLFSCATVNNGFDKKEDLINEVQATVISKKSGSKITDIQGKTTEGLKARGSIIDLRNVKFEDFLRVVFSEVIKRPYVLDRSVDQLDKRIDIQISRGEQVKNMISLVVTVAEKLGLDVDEIDGVMIFSRRGAASPGSPSGNSNHVSNSNPVSKGNIENSIPSDCVFSFRPYYSRAVDLNKGIINFLSGESKSFVNEASNQLVVKSTGKERRALIKLLRLLDVPQTQIAVDVTICEISLTGDFSIGFEGFLKKNNVSIETGSVVNNGLGITGGIFIEEWLRALIQIGEKRGLIKIRSNPFLLIADGVESQIEIGSEYPILTQTKSAQDTTIINSVDYRKTGLLLKILPVVSGDTVHLSSTIEMSEGEKNEVSTIDSPTILSRKVIVSNVMTSGQAVIVGGLIMDSRQDDNRFIPGIVGKYKLMTGKSYKESRTELVVILSVKIVNDSNVSESMRILGDKFQEQQFKTH